MSGNGNLYFFIKSLLFASVAPDLLKNALRLMLHLYATPVQHGITSEITASKINYGNEQTVASLHFAKIKIHVYHSN